MDWDSNLALATTGLTISDQDVEEFKHERSIRGFKSFEEIESLTVDENLSLLDRTLLLLGTGQEVQRVNAIQNLSVLLQENKLTFLQQVVPIFYESVKKGTQDLNTAAAKEVSSFVELGLLEGAELEKTFLPLTLENYDHSNPVISKAWQSALLSLIPFLPSEVIIDKIFPLAKSIGQLTQRVHLRLACCNLLGKLAINLETLETKKELTSMVQTLCQDIEFEVRANMCRQLGQVAKGVGQELTKTLVLPELIELANDEETFVRQTGLETVSDMLSLLDDDACTDLVVPLVKEFCTQVLERDQDDELLVVSRHIGKLAHGLSVNLTVDQVKWFLEVFRTLASLKSVDVNRNCLPSGGLKVVYFSGCTIIDDLRAECRRWCAYNFPAILLFASKWKLHEELLEPFRNLARDSHYLVRKTIACGAHEVCKMLGCDVGLVYPEIKLIIEDDSIDVLQGIVPHLPTTLQLLFEEGNGPNSCISVNVSELISPLLTSELTIGASHNWRLHVNLLQTFECLPDYFTSEQIFYKFVPLLFRLLSSSRVLPVKLAAGRTLCVFIKYNKRSDQRKDLCTRLINELGRGKSYQLRILYLDLCRFVMELFSKQFFKDHFYEFTFQVAFDPVVNVRIKFCGLLPALKSQIKLPTNRLLLQQLENCVRQMMTTESDRDVSAKVREVVVEMDKIVLAQDVGGLSKHPDDIADKLKEDHEKKLLEQERNLDNITNSKGHYEKGSPHGSNSTSRRKAPSFSQVTKDVSRRVGLTGIRGKDNSSKQTNSSKSDGNISSTGTTGKTAVSSRAQPSHGGRTISTLDMRRKNSSTSSSSSSGSVAKSQSTHSVPGKQPKQGVGESRVLAKKHPTSSKRN